jgi:cytochrome P450
LLSSSRPPEVAIPAGTFVFASVAAANRDPGVHREPDCLDITRSGAPPMLTLGGGFHYCVGVHLAKLELAEALSVMARRMPNIRRAGPAQWKPLLDLASLVSSPVEFDATVPVRGRPVLSAASR